MANSSIPKYAPCIEDYKVMFLNLDTLLQMVNVVFGDLNLIAPTTNEQEWA